MKKIILSLLLCLSLFLLPGCWDRTEINDLGIVTGIALDKKKDKGIELSVEMFIPRIAGGGQAMGGGGGGGKREILLRTGEGKTIANAIANLQEKLPRRVFWGHSKVIVISEMLAKEGIREPIDFLARHPQPRLRSYVFVSKSKAKDVMALLPPLERSSAEVLRELSASQMLISDAGAAVIPMVDILPPQKGLKELETIGYINKTAIFKKDKMIGHIDDSLTRGVLWLRDEIEQATVTIDPKTAKGGYVSVSLIRGRTELLPKIEDGKWKITVKAITEDDVVLNGTNLNLMNPKLVHMLEKQLEKKVEKRIEATLRKVQKEMKADIFGFAEIFHQKYPKQWASNKDRWEDIFPQVEVKVEVKAYIRRPGMSTTPQGVPEEEVKNK